MLTPSCSLSEGGGSSQDRARKDHSLDQLDQVLHNIDKGPSSLSSDSEIRFSLFCQNLITPLSVLTIPLSIHSFVPSVIHQQVFTEHRHYSRHWDAASNMKGRIQALMELTLEKGRQKMSFGQIDELEDLRVISAPKKQQKQSSSKCSTTPLGLPFAACFRPTKDPGSIVDSTLSLIFHIQLSVTKPRVFQFSVTLKSVCPSPSPRHFMQTPSLIDQFFAVFP